MKPIFSFLILFLWIQSLGFAQTILSGKVLDVNGVKQLANIPSKEVLLSQLCGLLMSPVSRTAVVLGALAAKKGEAAAA
jgi:large subunit ribosomal protein L10